MRWDGQRYAHDVKYGLYILLTDMELEKAKTMSNVEYTNLLKRLHHGINQTFYSLSVHGKPIVSLECRDEHIIFTYPHMLNNLDDRTLTVTWSMAARHIRAWVYDEQPNTRIVPKLGEYVSKEALGIRLTFETLCNMVGQFVAVDRSTESRDWYMVVKIIDIMNELDVNGKENGQKKLVYSDGTKRNSYVNELFIRTLSSRFYKLKTQEEQKMAFNLTPSANSGKLKMSSFLSDSNNIVDTEKKISLDKVVGWYNQPFKKYNDDKLKELSVSIRENGLLSPITVRPITDGIVAAIREQIDKCDDEQEKAELNRRSHYYIANIGSYEILSGHNRAEACRMLQWVDIPAIVREDIDDNHAQLIMVDANLQQRHKLLPSELAYAYKTQRDALEAIGVRGATSDIAEQYGVNRKTIWRYIKCTGLIKDMLDMLDTERFSLVTGVAISDLNEDNQQALYHWLLENPKKTIDDKMVSSLVTHNGEGFSSEDIDDILHPKKSAVSVKSSEKAIKLARSEITDIIGDDYSNDDITEFFYFCLQRSDLLAEWKKLTQSELDTYGLSEKCLSILKENGMQNKGMIDEWLSFGDGEKALGELYLNEVMKKVFGDEDFTNSEFDNEFDEDDVAEM